MNKKIIGWAVVLFVTFFGLWLPSWIFAPLKPWPPEGEVAVRILGLFVGFLFSYTAQEWRNRGEK